MVGSTLTKSSQQLSDGLRREADRLGFDAVGIAPAVAPPGHPRFLEWLERGHAAGMSYLGRWSRERSNPAYVFEGVRTIVMVALSYNKPNDGLEEPGRAKIARYAQGRDYHQVLWRRLGSLLDWIRTEAPSVQGRAVADTAPLLERDFAQLSGLGWIGKNTMLINRRLGSFTVLGALLLDVELDYDAPHEANHCGSCTRCLEACPTDAFVGPYELDARRCISYWTIEHKGPITETMATELNGWAFGCDICQDVCPWNRKAAPGRDPDLSAQSEWRNPDLISWMDRDEDLFKRSLKGTAMSRAKRSGLLRNAALILGTRRVLSAEPVLIQRLHDADPTIRASCAWALGRLGTKHSRAALILAVNDTDPAVRDAVRRALENGDD